MVPSIESLNLFGTAVRSVTIKLNNRCPLRCRHCSVGYSEQYPGDNTKITAEKLVDTIRAIDPSIYDMVLLAGGEPSLDPPLVRTAITACEETGLLSAIVTAPVWAPTELTAERFIERIHRMNVLILSYDEYHLDFLDVQNYKRAIHAAARAKIAVVVHIVYTDENVRDELKQMLSDVKHLCQFHESRTVPFGNAANDRNVLMSRIKVNTTEDLCRIPRGCVLGNALIDESGNVHGCCWSRSVSQSPFSEITDSAGLSAAMARLEERPGFASVRAHGFLDALTPSGKRILMTVVQGQSFAHECDICMRAMEVAPQVLWTECRNPYLPFGELPREVMVAPHA